MEREEKLKKIVKEKRSVKKAKALTTPGEAIPTVSGKKTSAGKRTGSSAAKMSPDKITDPTIEQIQLRAYFIGERRASLGISRDSTSDWVQAERELQAEAGVR
jgi:hypothetical protein